MDPQIHLIDETWIDAAPARVRDAVVNPTNWPYWWPGLTLSTTRDRGLKGMQWAAEGELRGSVEIWLEPFKNGVILHHFLRLDPADGSVWSRGTSRRRNRDVAWHGKRVFWRLKDELEKEEREKAGHM